VRSDAHAGDAGALDAKRCRVSAATSGHPAVAIVWKNILCLRRTMQIRTVAQPTLLRPDFQEDELKPCGGCRASATSLSLEGGDLGQPEDTSSGVSRSS